MRRRFYFVFEDKEFKDLEANLLIHNRIELLDHIKVNFVSIMTYVCLSPGDRRRKGIHARRGESGIDVGARNVKNFGQERRG